jgi:two-component system, NarL family, nitrate/nitrite response regulator NarL
MPCFKVLVVDDFAAFRQFVCSTLQESSEFHVVGQASDGLEAIQKAEDCQADVILMDIALPNLNGLEAARRISLVAPRSKIVFFSQIEDPGVVDSAFRGGSFGYVLKLDASRDLMPALESAVRGQKFVSRSLASVYP